MSVRWLPNALTLLRGALAGPLLWAVLAGEYRWALAIVLVAGLTDALDGYLAHRHGWQSRFGAVLDPLCDKLVLSAAMIGLWLVQALPTWLVVLVLARDALIVLGAAGLWLRRGPFTPEPSAAGKLTTFMHIVLVVGLLLDRSGVALPVGLQVGMVGASAVFTLASGLDYGLRYVWRASRPSGSGV